MEAILALDKAVSVHDENIHNLELRLLSHLLHDAFTTLDSPTQLEESRAQHNCIAQAIALKKKALGIEARNLLNNISRSDYLWLCMNTHAPKVAPLRPSSTMQV